MTTDTTRFDALFDDMTPKVGRCYCPNHYPPPADLPTGRARFDTDGWSAARAVQALGIDWSDTPLGPSEGQGGHAYENSIWLSPGATMPIRIAVHELAHCLHGHTKLPAIAMLLVKDEVEAEAESTAMLVCAALGLADDVEASKQYIYGYIGDYPIPHKVRDKIKAVASRILAAGATAAAQEAA